MQIMAGMMELNGCRIIVKEIAGGKMVLDTRIKSYDPIRKVVKVSAGSLDNRMEHAVTVIIFGPNGSLVEATGNLRKVIIANEVEIELGRSKNGEKRKHVRYPLKEKGYIEEETFEKIKKFRKIFKGIELNSREVLFEKIPEAIYGNIDDNAYEKCTQEVLKIKKCMSENLYFTKIKTATDIKKIFGEKANDSLGECLKTWYVEQSEKAKSHIFSENITGFMTYIGQLKTNDELEIVSRVCKIISGIYINDWKNDSFEQFMDELVRVKASVEAVKENNESGSGENRIYIENGGNKVERFYETDDDDSTSYFLQNAIEEALEEFGDTLELNQKVSVLAKALEDLLSK